MPVKVVSYDTTPNPDALKCNLDTVISNGPRSFLNASVAANDALANQLFSKASLTNLYINGNWMTISRSPNTSWTLIKQTVEQILHEYSPPTSQQDASS